MGNFQEAAHATWIESGPFLARLGDLFSSAENQHYVSAFFYMPFNAYNKHVAL